MPAGVEITLEVERPRYRMGETVRFSGRITNSSDHDLTLVTHNASSTEHDGLTARFWNLSISPVAGGLVATNAGYPVGMIPEHEYYRQTVQPGDSRTFEFLWDQTQDRRWEEGVCFYDEDTPQVRSGRFSAEAYVEGLYGESETVRGYSSDTVHFEIQP